MNVGRIAPNYLLENVNDRVPGYIFLYGLSHVVVDKYKLEAMQVAGPLTKFLWGMSDR